MVKRKTEIKMRSCGIYTHWDASSKDLPQFAEATTRVPANVGVEFGFIVNIKGCKNQQLEYCIDHPGILDANGKRRPPFDGVVFIKSNDWNFYLGDTIWEPVADKLGVWHLYLDLDGTRVAEESFLLYRDDAPA